MNQAPAHLASRFLQGVGLADLPLAEAEKRLASYGAGSSAEFTFVGATTNADEALAFLSTLTWPATRYVAFANGAKGTAIVDNARNGSDPADHVARLPRHLGRRFARVLDRPGCVWKRDKLRLVQQYAARVFDLHDAEGNVVRSIACTNDGGRWTYSAAGEPHAIETAWGTPPKRTSDRLPSEQLAQLCDAFGLPLPRAGEFLGAPRFAMFAQESLQPTDTCTVAEADDPARGYYLRGLNWARHLETHAASVVADFERCLEIDPTYETKVGDLLREARRRLGSTA